jgi:hypothetical protein
MENVLLNATVSISGNTHSEIKFRANDKFFSCAALHYTEG